MLLFQSGFLCPDFLRRCIFHPFFSVRALLCMSRKVSTTESPSIRELLRNNHFMPIPILREPILQIAKSCHRGTETAGFQQQSLFSPLLRCAHRRRAELKTRSDAPFNAAKGTLVNNAPIKASNESTFQPINEMLAEDRATP